MTREKLQECERRCRDAAGQMAVLQCEDGLPDSMRYQLTQVMRDMSEMRGFFQALLAVGALKETEKLHAGRQKPGGPLKREQKGAAR